MSFGKRLKDRREELNLSRKDVAQKINISYPAYAHYENNEQFPKKDVLVHISTILDVSIDYLLGISKQKNNNIKLSSKELCLLEEIKNLSDNGFNMVLNYAKFISEQDKNSKFTEGNHQ